MVKYEVGKIVKLKGNTANAMKFHKGVIRRIGKTNKGKKIFHVSKIGSSFTTPFQYHNLA